MAKTRTQTKNQNSGSNWMALTGMILGIIAIALSFIPIVNNISLILGFIGGVLAIFGIVRSSKLGRRGMAIAGTVLSVLAIVISLSLQNQWSKDLDKADQEIQKSFDDAEDEMNSAIDEAGE